MSTLKYRPELDGLRAFAIIPVILFHIHERLFPGGFIGVDVFFVISGYLITSLILREYEAERFSFRNFYARRVRRIFPALIVMVIFTQAVCLFLLYAPDIGNASYHGLASLLSFANFSHMMQAGDYWGFKASQSPFLHTWSLSVEEQFYILFPALLVLTLKYLKKYLAIILCAVVVISFIFFVWSVLYKPVSAFYLAPARGWELGAGCLAAVLGINGSKIKANNVWGTAGLIIILLSYLLLPSVSAFIVIPVIGTLMIIVATADTSNFVTKLLKSRVCVYIGKISYSLYIWHWPVLVMAKSYSEKFGTDINLYLVVLLIVILSVASYHFVESAREKKKVVPYILGVWAAGIAFTVYILSFDMREDISMFSVTDTYNHVYSVVPLKARTGNKRNAGIIMYPGTSVTDSTYLTGGIIKLYGLKTPEIVLLGDSHANMWAKVIDEAAMKLHHSISFYAANGLPPFFNVPPVSDGGKILQIDLYKFDCARYYYLNCWHPKLLIVTTKWDNPFLDTAQITEFMNYTQKLEAKVMLIEQPPLLYFGDKNAPQYLSFLRLKPEPGQNKYIKINNDDVNKRGKKLLMKLVKTYDNVIFIPVADRLSKDGKAWVLDFKNVLYIDDDHLSQHGALICKDRILNGIQEAFKAESR